MAGEIFILSAGGGGGSLNYEVVSGTSAPSSPSENTIWVNTSTAITSHVFSSTKPSSPSAGMVWFNVGSSSPAAMNVLDDDNKLFVYPSSCQQYVSGAWVSKTAKTYVGGKWVDWATYLYTLGNLYEDLTGGWEAKTGNWRDVQSALPTVTSSANGIRVYQNGGNNSWGVSTKNTIDLSNYKKYTMKINVTEARTGDGIAVWASTPKTIAAGTVFPSVNVNGISTYPGQIDVELDVSSLSGKYYVGFRGSNGNTSIFDATILEARLE